MRGANPHFLPLLQPILTAPAWLAGDVATGYRLVQAIDALAFSLAAVPVYLLARRLRLSRPLALAAGALAVAVPDGMLVGWVVSEPIAYPLALGALAAGVAALDRPSKRGQLAFLLLSGLAAFDRIQLVVLPLCYLVALLTVGLRERRLRRALREQLVFLAPIALALLAFLSNPHRNYGSYPNVFFVHVGGLDALRLAGENLLVAAYASGWVLVPGAVLGLGLALARPRHRAELAFAALGLALLVALLAQASLYGDASEVQERYLFYAFPLAALGFSLYVSRGWPGKLLHTLAATVALAVVGLFPLAPYAAAMFKQQSPTLFGEFRIELALGSPGAGSQAVALAAGAALVLVAAAALRPRLGTPAALAIALALCVAGSVAAASFDDANSGRVRDQFLPADSSWVDRAAAGPVSLAVAPGDPHVDSLEQLFWNASIDRVLLLPGTVSPDTFAASATAIGPDGSLTVHGRPVAGPVLMDEYAVTAGPRDARVAARGPTKVLWVPTGSHVRLSYLVVGRYHDGWLSQGGALFAWPSARGRRIAGRIAFTLTPPGGVPAQTMTVRTEGRRVFRIRVRAHAPTRVSVPVCSTGKWAARYSFPGGVYLGDGRRVVAHATSPTFTADPAACAALPRPAPLPPAQ